MDFLEQILHIMERKTHPSLQYINWHASNEQFRMHSEQEFGTYVSPFPYYIEALLTHDLAPTIRQELEENLAEEKFGKISGFGPHRDLYLHTQHKMGFPLDGFLKAERGETLFYQSRLYKQWLEKAVQESPIVGISVITLFVEGSSNDRKELSWECSAEDRQALYDQVINNTHPDLLNHPLVKKRRLKPEDLLLKKAHLIAEPDHRKSAYNMAPLYADSLASQAKVIGALKKTLDLWLSYTDNKAREIGVPSIYLN